MVAAQIATMGSAILMIVPGASAQGGFMGGTGSGRPLQRDDVEAILQARAVRYVVPVDRTVAQVVSSQPQLADTGHRHDDGLLRAARLAGGPRALLYGCRKRYRSEGLCPRGKPWPQNLFGDSDPVGQQVRVKQMPCEIIGVLAAKGQSAMGSDQDDILIIAVGDAANAGAQSKPSVCQHHHGGGDERR
jgi:putative ABC transport system permease protein